MAGMFLHHLGAAIVFNGFGCLLNPDQEGRKPTRSNTVRVVVIARRRGKVSNTFAASNNVIYVGRSSKALRPIGIRVRSLRPLQH
jgi:hypothetical protein